VDTDEPASGTPEPSPSPLLTQPSSASDERETDSTGGARLPRRLRRRVHGRLIAGVAGGLADAAGVSPALFRLGFVLLTLLGGLLIESSPRRDPRLQLAPPRRRAGCRRPPVCVRRASGHRSDG